MADAIGEGRLKPGMRLPGTRSLARSLGLNRNTVAAAYAELRAEGWVSARRGEGTRVSEVLPEVQMRAGALSRPGKLGFALEARPAQRKLDEVIGDRRLKWDFGVPDVRLTPTRELARALRRTLRAGQGGPLEYDRYRRESSQRLTAGLGSMLSHQRGLHIEPGQLIVTSGSQMALYLIARTLLRAGDRVAVENPGHPGAWQTFRAAGARLCPVPVDSGGLQVDALERLQRRGALRAVFLTPQHQFPTTVPLAMERRLALLQFAREHRVAVIEDDYDHDFHYQGRPLLPLARSDNDGLVIYISSLSKLLGPGLRLGYLVGPRALTDRVAAHRELVDLQGDRVLETAVAELLEDGDLQRHLNRACRLYRQRRDFLCAELQRELGDVLHFTVPGGGMALWAEVHRSVDVEKWAERASAQGMAIRTGRPFFIDHRPRARLRLGFARWDFTQLFEGVQRLKRAMPRRSSGSVIEPQRRRAPLPSGPAQKSSAEG